MLLDYSSLRKSSFCGVVLFVVSMDRRSLLCFWKHVELLRTDRRGRNTRDNISPEALPYYYCYTFSNYSE